LVLGVHGRLRAGGAAEAGLRTHPKEALTRSRILEEVRGYRSAATVLDSAQLDVD
jgi:hypothetical protein